MARYHSNGELDTSFSADGFDISSFEENSANEAHTVNVQSDGKIVVAGRADFSTVSLETSDRVILRYNSDGTRDASFGDGDAQLLSPNSESFDTPVSAALQADGKLVLLSIYRYNARVDRYDLNLGPLTASADIDVTDDDTNADLKAVSFNVTNDHVVTGIANLTFTIRNVGAVATPAFRTHVVWSTNATLGDADDQIVTGSVQSFAGLNASVSASRNFNLTLDRTALYAHALLQDPSGSPVGTPSADFSNLFLVIDVNNEVTENSEANNSGVALGVDSDRITYFPWDKNRNGTVEPLEALTTIQAIGTADPASDFDRNGVVSPFEALSAMQRIGYTLNLSKQSKTAAASVAPKLQAVTSVAQPVAAFRAPVLAKPLTAATSAGSESERHSVLSPGNRAPQESAVWWSATIDEERPLMFSTENAVDSEMRLLPEDDDPVWGDDEFSIIADWLSMI